MLENGKFCFQNVCKNASFYFHTIFSEWDVFLKSGPFYIVSTQQSLQW